VHHTTGRRQLKLSYHIGEVPDLFDHRLRRHRPERHAEPSHSRAHRPSELGDIPDGLLADGLRLALGIPGLAQGGCVLLPGHPQLLQLSLGL
jgi:hypothetical protein